MANFCVANKVTWLQETYVIRLVLSIH
jgi:hypothetical protein